MRPGSVLLRHRDWFNLEIGPIQALPLQPRVLLLDHTLVQLLEERRRPAPQVGVVLTEEVGYMHGGAPALVEFPALQVEVFSDTGCKIPSV